MINTKKDKYDYIIIGAGFAGAVHAHELHMNGDSVLVIERRKHIGGNCYTEKIGKIDVHRYGSHIFHTNNDFVWQFINQFAKFNDYKHRVIANTSEEHVMLPFTMTTFMQLFNVSTVEEVKKIIQTQISMWMKINKIDPETFEPSNFEEQAISIVGTTIYNKLIKHYTEKQWGRKATDLPAEIIKRLPLRWNTDTTYFNNAKYQGIPTNGYTEIFENMLDGIEVINADIQLTELDYLLENKLNENGKIIYTGEIDRLFYYYFGQLEYRSLIFETEILETQNYQGTACLNFTDKNSKFTRITEHKHYSLDKEVLEEQFTVISKEYSVEFNKDDEALIPFYPIGDSKNKDLWKKYNQLVKRFNDKLVLSGRLATYQYLDMDKTIEQALESVHSILNNKVSV